VSQLESSTLAQCFACKHCGLKSFITPTTTTTIDDNQKLQFCGNCNAELLRNVERDVIGCQRLVSLMSVSVHFDDENDNENASLLSLPIVCRIVNQSIGSLDDLIGRKVGKNNVFVK
jgi:hypothetical protein